MVDCYQVQINQPSPNCLNYQPRFFRWLPLDCITRGKLLNLSDAGIYTLCNCMVQVYVLSFCLPCLLMCYHYKRKGGFVNPLLLFYCQPLPRAFCRALRVSCDCLRSDFDNLFCVLIIYAPGLVFVIVVK